jgi:hypothetical protein
MASRATSPASELPINFVMARIDWILGQIGVVVSVFPGIS